jgi:hypothetical protein
MGCASSSLNTSDQRDDLLPQPHLSTTTTDAASTKPQPNSTNPEANQASQNLPQAQGEQDTDEASKPETIVKPRGRKGAPDMWTRWHDGGRADGGHSQALRMEAWTRPFLSMGN